MYGFLWWLSGKESACNAGDPGSIPGLGRSPREGMATHSSILAWKIPYTEEPSRLQSMGSQSQTQLSAFAFTFTFKAPSLVSDGRLSALRYNHTSKSKLG